MGSVHPVDVACDGMTGEHPKPFAHNSGGGTTILVGHGFQGCKIFVGPAGVFDDPQPLHREALQRVHLPMGEALTAGTRVTDMVQRTTSLRVDQ